VPAAGQPGQHAGREPGRIAVVHCDPVTLAGEGPGDGPADAP